MSDPKISMILYRDVDQKLKLWACRGEGKGCARNKFRTAKKPCDDCVPCHDEQETLGDALVRIERGNG